MWKIYFGFLQGNNLKIRLFFRDDKVVQVYEVDLLVYDCIFVVVGIDMMQEGDWLMQQKGGFFVLLLIVYGEVDGVIFFEVSEIFVVQLEGDVIFKGWAGLYYEIYNELEKEVYFQYVEQWLSVRIV